MKKKTRSIEYFGGVFRKSFPFAIVALTTGVSSLLAPSLVMAAPPAYKQVEEVVVTARRKEENIEDVPIAISVYSQDDLNKANIVSGSDLALYNPSLSANNRFGSDQASFAIRGFTQELRTTASVGVYFADVVAPRGSGLVVGGDGAGPGYFFDLQNVQVLKGPQGTLFGRNTTGGAVVLTPQKPTENVEGYLEVGGGNYGMKRAQGALNVPITDRIKTRFGFDTQQRDGYLNNVSGIGPKHLADVDYLAARASMLIDITDNIENYTIVNYLHSENNGVVSPAFACNSDPTASVNAQTFGRACTEQLSVQGSDFYDVMSLDPKPQSKIENWQAINTTKWELSDDLTVKNILSYASVKKYVHSTVFGTAWKLRDYRVPFTGTYPVSGLPTDSETSFIEELQFQGMAFDGDLTWQAGLYFENNKPNGESGSVSPFLSYCDPTPSSIDPNTFNCIDSARLYLFQDQNNTGDAGPVGFVQTSLGKVEYTSKALYSEGTYTFSDAFNMTLGLRYTEDKTESESRQFVYRDLPPAPGVVTADPIAFGPPTNVKCTLSGKEPATVTGCYDRLDNSSDAVTGQISFNYYPIEGLMTYVKYAKGYRQAGVNVLGPEGLRPFEAEKVDAYEMGAKSSFEGYISGSWDIAAFYNKLNNQQIQENIINSTNNAVSTTAIINVGASKIAGVELNSTLRFPWQMILNLSYTHLETEVTKFADFQLPPNSAYDQVEDTVYVGSDLTFSPKHNLTATLTQMLPVPLEWGDMSLGMTYVFTDTQLSTSNSPYGVLPSFELWNFNYNWNGVFGSQFDFALFVTNAKDEEVTNYVNGLYSAIGNEYRIVGEPRMYGAKLRYTFD